MLNLGTIDSLFESQLRPLSHNLVTLTLPHL